MELDLITKQDLLKLRNDLLKEIHARNVKDDLTIGKWLRSYQVQQMLSISASSLQNMRIQGTIPFSKLNGTLFYYYDDINDVLEKNKLNEIKY